MTKTEFLSRLREALNGLPPEDLQKSLDYYAEIIDDRVEDGAEEEAAVAALGSVDDIVAEILAETPLPRLIRQKIAPKEKKPLRGWAIALIVLGAPLWIPVLLMALTVLVSIYVVLWAVFLAIVAAVAALGVGALAGVAGLVLYLLAGTPKPALLLFGLGLVCAGLTLLGFLLCRLIFKGGAALHRKLLTRHKRRYLGKGASK